MFSRYGPILRTYRRWPLLLVVGMSPLYVLVTALSRAGVNSPLWFFGCMMVIQSSMRLAEHWKELLGSPLSRTLPDAQRRHVVVACGIIAVWLLMLYLPLVLLRHNKLLEGVTTAACLGAVFCVSVTIAFCWPLLQLLSTFALMVAPMAALFRGNGTLVLPASVELTVGAVAVAAASLMALLPRMLRLSEESPEYWRRTSTDPYWVNRSHWLGSSGWGARAAQQFDYRFRPTTWGRVSRWMAASVQRGRSAWLIGFLFPIGFVALLAGATRRPMSQTVAAWLVLLIGTFQATIVVANLAAMRKKFFTVEVLRPQTRSQQVQAVGLALARLAAAIWLGAVMASLFIARLWWGAWPVDVLNLQRVAFSAALTAAAVGVALWGFRFAANMIVAIAVGAFVVSQMVFMSFIFRSTIGQVFDPTSPLPWWPLLPLAAVGGLFTWRAQAYWMNADLD